MRFSAVLNGGVGGGTHPALFEAFCDEFTREINRLRIEEGTAAAALEAELPRIDRDLAKLLQAIKDGGPGGTIVAEMKRLEARRAEVAARLADAAEPPPLLRTHPARAADEGA
ncbi:MAG: hypothetical protein IPM60_09720 [Rhodospirillales bacterium]|nr:hypothetical protein [Rhodospirillales bacterium]